MAQDFAKKRTAQAPAARKSGRANVRPVPANSSALNWFITGLFSGVLCMVLVYVGWQHYQAQPPTNTEALNTEQTDKNLPVFDFDFYHELADTEVAVSVPTTPASPNAPPNTTTNTNSTSPSPVTNTGTTPASSDTPPTTPTATINFLLQAGSFQERGEAEARRAKITLLNMGAEIVPGVVAGRTWFRVQVGPFAGRAPAEEARKALSASNIDSILLVKR